MAIKKNVKKAIRKVMNDPATKEYIAKQKKVTEEAIRKTEKLARETIRKLERRLEKSLRKVTK